MPLGTPVARRPLPIISFPASQFSAGRPFALPSAGCLALLPRSQSYRLAGPRDDLPAAAISHGFVSEDNMTEVPAPRPAERVEKPWGYEEIFAIVEGRYIGKILHVASGESLSLQWHHDKDETILVLSGQVVFDVGISEDDLRAVPVAPGEAVHMSPRLLHRVRALSDAVLVEASTAVPGWREDVVRLEDRYGRSGTSAP
jgi:mannose-6-phosphate isomerase-like protein (cupin superfamily)